MNDGFTQEAFEFGDLPDMVEPNYAADQSIDERFAAFHELNPHVYDELRRLALDLVHRGHHRIGIGMLTEIVRWSRMRTSSSDGFKVNNTFRSRYARMLEADPRLTGVFELRRLRSAHAAE